MGGNPQITPIPIDYIRYEPGVKTTVAYTNKGTVSAYEDLPSTSNLVEGDMYQIGDTDDYYVWDGRYWNLVTLPESGGNVEHITWHQCPEVVRNYLAEAMSAYPTTTTTIIDQYAPQLSEISDSVVQANSQPVGYTVDDVTFYDNEPNVETLFMTQNTIGTLTALDFLRWYKTTLASPAPGSSYPRGKNCRDLGGWPCDGGTVKYGMLVRGSEPNAADQELMVDKIGIRTEVQLLPVSEQATDYKMSSPWDITWKGNDTENTSVYSPADISDPAKKALWAKILTDIMDSIIARNPVYFHCGVGADRTGVIALMLEAILGVSRSNLDIDFELTNFPQGWQNINGSIYRGRAYPTYVAMMNDILQIPLVGGLTDTFRNHCLSFVLSLGISVEKINKFRAIMIDGSPDEIVVSGTYNVQVTLSNCTTSSQITEVDAYEPLTITVTPNTGYTLTNAAVTVTMGANDASQYYSNGVLSIPSIDGDVSLSVSAVALQNLFDSSAATYNARIRNVGIVASDMPGRVVTGVIAISGISTFSVSGITEVKGSDNSYAQIALYSSSVGDSTDKLYVYSNPSATYSYDVAALKLQYPSATHARLAFVLSTSSITTTDTANLKIYGE